MSQKTAWEALLQLIKESSATTNEKIAMLNALQDYIITKN
jgi:hypothetical protein